KGLNRIRVDGTDFIKSYEVMNEVIADVRRTRRPWLIHAKVSLLNHHTSGVRKEFYRSKEDLEKHFENDPLPKLRNVLLQDGIDENILKEIESAIDEEIAIDFSQAVNAVDPDPSKISDHIFLPTPVKEEKGERVPPGKEKVMMV